MHVVEQWWIGFTLETLLVLIFVRDLFLKSCLSVFFSVCLCVYSFSRGSAPGVLLWALWEIQCHGSGAAWPKFRRPLWSLWQDLFTEDSLNDSNSAGEFCWGCHLLFFFSAVISSPLKCIPQCFRQVHHNVCICRDLHTWWWTMKCFEFAAPGCFLLLI